MIHDHERIDRELMKPLTKNEWWIGKFCIVYIVACTFWKTADILEWIFTHITNLY